MNQLAVQFCKGDKTYGLKNCTTNVDNYQAVDQYQCYLSPYDSNIGYCINYLENGSTIYQTHYINNAIMLMQ